jgi:hypothetical protein
MEQLIKRCQIAFQIGLVENELPEDFVQSIINQGDYTPTDLFLARAAARVLNEDYVEEG